MTHLVRNTITIINSLHILRDQTSNTLTALQKLSCGYLPMELVPTEEVQKMLKSVRMMLLQIPGNSYIAVDHVKFYYGIQTASYAYNDQLVIMVKISLTSNGATFQNYDVHSVKLPIDSMEDGGNQQYTKVSGNLPYFAISTDGLHYLAMTQYDLDQCQGMKGFPKICNPIKVMNAVKTKPSCTLSLYTGNATMMAKYCDIQYFEQDEPDAQIYHITQGQVLITSNEGQFDMHCPSVTPPISIDACRLCIITLPCGCYIKSKSSVVPPLLDGCSKTTSSTKVKFPINLLVLSQI